MIASSFILAWLRVTGENLPDAEVNFQPGLNVIYGASDTGKSSILMLIDYIFGAGPLENLAPEIKKYSSVHLAFEIRGTGKRVLSRSLTGGDIEVAVADEDWRILSSSVVSAKHVKNGNNDISNLLLTIIDLQNRLILHGPSKKAGLSFRNMVKFIIIDEGRIIHIQTPAIASLQRLEHPQSLSLFHLLLTGRDAAEVKLAPDAKIEKASWRGKTELFNEMIVKAQAQIESGLTSAAIQEQLQQTNNDILRIAERIEHSTGERESLMEQRKTNFDQIQSVSTRLLTLDQLLNRFDLLESHYRSDLERLRFISDGDFLMSQLGQPHCPYCGLEIDEHTAEHLLNGVDNPVDVQESASVEAQKIHDNLSDLIKTMSLLREERAALADENDYLSTALTGLDEKINRDLEPQIAQERSELSRLAEDRSRLETMLFKIHHLNDLEEQRNLLGDEPKASRTPGGSAIVMEDVSALRSFGDEIAVVLNSWNYECKIVEYTKGKDIIVDGQARASHGKGLRAVFHAAFSIALMKYCDIKSLKHTGFVLLDSPLTSLKEGNAYSVDNNIQTGFYKSLSELPKHLQVIVFENKEPDKRIQENSHCIHFTGTLGEGRYGFIPVSS